MTAFDFLEGTMSLQRAYMGDLTIILERLRDGSELMVEEREFLAEIIDGTRKRPPYKVTALETTLRNNQIVEEIEFVRAAFPEVRHVVTTVAVSYALQDSYVHSLVRTAKRDHAGYAKLQKRVRLLVDLYEKRQGRARLRRRRRHRRLKVLIRRSRCRTSTKTVRLSQGVTSRLS